MSLFRFSSVAAACACLFAALPLRAQEFPARPIRLIVANTPGTNLDHVARITGPELSKIIGQPVVVENRPGASTVIGTEYVAKQAPADGYTLAVISVGSLAILPVISKELRFDPLKDIPPILGLVEARLFVGSSAKMPWKSFAEMVAQAKANPGKFTFGASSPNARLPLSALSRELEIDLLHVPFSSGAPYLQALLTGEVSFGMVAESSLNAWGEKFRPLAVTGNGRMEKFPDVPTFAELGHSSVRGGSYTLNGPAGLPRPVFEKLRASASQMLRQPGTKELFAKIPMDVAEQSPEAAMKSLQEEARLYLEVARRLGLAAN